MKIKPQIRQMYEMNHFLAVFICNDQNGLANYSTVAIGF